MDRSTTIGRRIRTVPAVYLAWLVTLALLPLLVPVALAVDLVRWLARRTPWMAIRLIAFLTAYLTAEAIGLIALFGVWVAAGLGRRRPWLERATFSVQKAWSGFVFWSVKRVFSLRFDIEGIEAVQPEPYLIFSRHASIVDNLLPSQFITRPFGTHIRYVMKHELLMDPALDVAGNRLPNAFIRRGAGESDREITSIRALGASLGPGEAVLIYPEGTRFTEAKLASARRRLEQRSPRLAAIAGGLRNVLPPRLGGPLALLESCAADVVVLAHRGLDGFARVADIWRGGMVRTRVTVRFHRVPRAEIPEDRADRADWLFRVWQELDEWVGRPAAARV